MSLKKIKTAVLLAGGRGTRLSEQTKEIPKPLVKVGPYPICVHIMRKLAEQGIKNFYLLGGYLNEEIWAYLLKNIEPGTFPYPFSQEYLGVQLEHSILPADCRVYLLYTGENSGTAERIKKIQHYIGNQPFLMTYGDGYSDVDVSKVEELLVGDRVVSLCGVPYTERFGLVKVEEDGTVTEFKEKSQSTTHFVNGGFMCMTPEIFNYINDKDFDFSKDVLEKEELSGKISAYIYRGYWKAVDTQRDLDTINKDYINHKEYFVEKGDK